MTDPRSRFRIETAFFFLAALTFCGTATQWQWFRTLDFGLYDGMVREFALPVLDEVIIVGIDEQSLATRGPWPWSRDQQSDLLDAVADGKPRAVLVDVVYGGETEPDSDEALVRAAARVEVLALPLMVDALAAGRQLIEVMPFPDLLEHADVLGHVHVELDADATARGVYLHQGVGDAHWPHLTLSLAERLHPDKVVPNRCDASDGFTLLGQRCGFVYLPFAGPPGSYPELSADDLMRGSVSPDVLTDKVVLIGITANAAQDSVTSPVSANERPMSGVEFNANLYSALVQNRTINEAQRLLLLALALGFAGLPALLLPRMSAKPMLLSATLFAAAPLAVSVISFAIWQMHVPIASATVTCLLCYPYWSWRRNEIAWRFVEAEIARLELEKPRWAGVRPEHSPEDIGRLEHLLGAQSLWRSAPDGRDGGHEIELAMPDGRTLVLMRDEPFSSAERALAKSLLVSIASEETGEERLPGERLAAQIRKLKIAAREVRSGREIGLRGLSEMPNGVAVLSALNRVLFVNQACRRLLGMSPSQDVEDLDQLMAGIVTPLGKTWLELSREVVFDHVPFVFETTNASNVPVVVEAAPLAHEDEVVESWVVTVTDMTDVRVAERDREEALAFLSHDLRSPMTSVLALLRSGRGAEVLDDIGRYTQQALSVSEQFLQLSRVQAKEQFEVYELDLAAVIDNAVDSVYPMAAQAGQRIRINQPADLDEGAWIRGNGELLERAIVNLLSNAIKYAASEAPIDVDLAEETGGSKGSNTRAYVVTVQDHGPGIPADEVPHVFDPYFRSTDPELAEQRGSGLGLRFVKTVVERHGGTIGVSSVRGEGSRFALTLPVA
jgi:signal transduction histidine kinase/CHASE2 domain-containing sensor protein